MPIDRLGEKFKMGQNRKPEDTLAAASFLRAAGSVDVELVATEMESRARKN